MNVNLPADPIMLMSFVNMKLRDYYPDLEALCEDMDISSEELINKLKAAGFEYDKEHNKFI